MIALAIAAATILVCAAAAELGARRWMRRRGDYYVFVPGQRLRLRIDRETLPQLEEVTRIEINADGERGPEPPPCATGNRPYRVLVAGGSQPEGYLLDQDTTWPGALGHLLASPDRLRALGASASHVGSIAKSGVGAEALDTILARVLPRYPRLSVVILLVGASDVLRWLEEGAPAAAPSAPVPAAELFRCHPEGPFGWTPRRLALTELAWRAYIRTRRPLREHADAGRWLRKARAMRARARVVRATLPNPDVMLAHFERCLHRAIARAQQHADRVIVVRQPWYAKEALTTEEVAQMWHGGAGRVWCEDVTTFYSIEVTARLMALMDARAVRVAEEAGVEHVDLLPVLEPSLDTYYDFFHLTPAGARVVAAAVADALVHAAPTADVSPCVDLRAS